MNSFFNYIANVLFDLNNRLNHGEKLCGCRSLQFNGGHLPDYNDPLVQDIYILRYGLAYAYEYKQMYSRFFQESEVGKNLEVVSVGCGNMIDYWALRKEAPKNCKIVYHGVDTIEWNKRFYSFLGPTVDFNHQSISEYLAARDKLTADVYVFPKSISEISDAELEKICNIIREKGIDKKEVHLLFAMRANETSLKMDWQKTTRLYKVMCEVGMECSNELNINGADSKVYELDENFNSKLNSIVYKTLDNLPNMCKNYKNQECTCNFCEENRNRPMLNNQYMRLQIFTFRKAA